MLGHRHPYFIRSIVSVEQDLSRAQNNTVSESQYIITLIQSVQLGYSTEDQLQSDLHELFQRSNLDVIREFRINARDRVDFLVKAKDCNIAVECKVKGSASSVMAQVARYAESDQVSEIVLVTSKRMHLASEAFRERVILGKPLTGVWIGGMR